MRMICLETTDREGSLALFANGELIDQRRLSGPQRTAQSFAPMMRELIHQAGWQFAEIDHIAVAAGPGSFTGLRIGVTAAKTLAYLTGAQLLGVSTLDVLAWRAFHEFDASGPLWTVLDAQRAQLFAARYGRRDDCPLNFAAMEETVVLDIDDWLGRLSAGDWVTGPAIHKLVNELPNGAQAVPEDVWRPTAEAVGRVAAIGFAAGEFDDPFQLVPAYHRLSAAEEKRAARNSES